MSTKDNKLINNYINGEDIHGYSLEKLQDNKLFMEKVIDISNDYKMYYHCSKKVKTDPGFIRFLIKKFTNKKDFLCEAVDYYFDNQTNDYNSIEIAIIMRALLKGRDDERYYKYEMIRDLMYVGLRLQVEVAKGEEDEQFKYDTGLGFWYVLDTYRNNEIVIYYYAKKMLNELFIDDYYAIDRILHKQFSTAEEVEENGVYNTLINMISMYDNMLSCYVSVHKDLLKGVIKRVYSALKRWDKYVDLYESQQFDDIYEKVYEYVENNPDSVLSARELLCFAGIQLGIAEKLVQYQIIDQIDIDMVKEEEDEYFKTINRSFVDKSNYNNVKRIIKSILFSNKTFEKKKEKDNNIVDLNAYKKKKCK